MRESQLPSPGLVNVYGPRLRRDCANAISGVQIVASKSGGKTRQANQLHAFFTACATALASLRDLVVPTVATRVRTAANTVVVTFNEDMDKQFVPPTTAFVFTPARTVTAVAWTGSRQVTITATGAVAGDTLAYTQPGAATNVRDLAGNLLANFSAAAVA